MEVVSGLYFAASWPHRETRSRLSLHLKIQSLRERLPRIAEYRHGRRPLSQRPRASLNLRYRSRWPRGFSSRCPMDAKEGMRHPRFLFWNFPPPRPQRGLSLEINAIARAEPLTKYQRLSVVAALIPQMRGAPWGRTDRPSQFCLLDKSLPQSLRRLPPPGQLSQRFLDPARRLSRQAAPFRAIDSQSSPVLAELKRQSLAVFAYPQRLQTICRMFEASALWLSAQARCGEGVAPPIRSRGAPRPPALSQAPLQPGELPQRPQLRRCRVRPRALREIA